MPASVHNALELFSNETRQMHTRTGPEQEEKGICLKDMGDKRDFGRTALESRDAFGSLNNSGLRGVCYNMQCLKREWG